MHLKGLGLNFLFFHLYFFFCVFLHSFSFFSIRKVCHIIFILIFKAVSRRYVKLVSTNIVYYSIVLKNLWYQLRWFYPNVIDIERPHPLLLHCFLLIPTIRQSTHQCEPLPHSLTNTGDSQAVIGGALISWYFGWCLIFEFLKAVDSTPYYGTQLWKWKIAKWKLSPLLGAVTGARKISKVFQYETLNYFACA